MKKPKTNPENATIIKKHNHPDGLDKWNDRLDHNLETEHEGDETADEQARDYSEKYGSGDQSDETKEA
ncbi:MULTISPECIES: hypothetical protein [Pedobacter]|uniref:Uncharacterized protein n=1 Tax=Pedobacter heparinus (strain ATCC 13125 / DSM 2366 / CIP 104194 / JCM 7457 / NBRC 12017 / NCIMB 9290 / NRRL B-14731 / HIM 762-3) TaxID=485917 RepID=C6Y492_PEDHD|nr:MULTISPECIES: hypothetical protein [Pedobacter]ACU05535.1 hypothetical protein Phep_3341 [Pedobacter heparinus DSM 2366]MBB5440500.1 hypothetical protein [Pedobacter sp. AK017]